MQLNLIETVAFAGVVLYLGEGIRRLIPPLARYNIPAPVVGGLLVAIVVAGVLKTQFGRDFARNYVEELVAPKVKGKLHIGRITGLSFGGATIDSAEIRGPDDSVFVALRRITVRCGSPLITAVRV